jgi:hypothetical protein
VCSGEIRSIRHPFNPDKSADDIGLIRFSSDGPDFHWIDRIDWIDYIIRSIIILFF